MEDGKRIITFITAAYGRECHQIVRGLALTFYQSNNPELIIYTDSNFVNP